MNDIRLVVASNNKHKLVEFKSILGDSFDGIVTPSELGLSLDVVEDGATFYENALKKAREFSNATGLAAIADDSGLEVDALGGAPSIYSARYAGTLVDADNRALLLKNLEDVAEKDRTARFVCQIVVYYPDGRIIAAQGVTEGKILFEETGENGFGYDCIFYSNDLQKSFGLASPAEKNAVSHRGRALKLIKEQI